MGGKLSTRFRMTENYANKLSYESALIRFWRKRARRSAFTIQRGFFLPLEQNTSFFVLFH